MQLGSKNSRLGEPVLILAALVWGSAIPLTKDLLSELEPWQLMCTRFILATILLAPLAWFRRGEFSLKWIKPGLICGFLLSLTFGAMMLSVKYTSATRSGFLFGMFVVIVPFLSYLLFREKPGVRSWIGVVLAVAGSWFMTSMDNSQNLPFNIGDVMALFTAACASAHLIAVGRYAKNLPAFWLHYLQCCFAMCASLIWCLLDDGLELQLSTPAWLKIWFLVFFCTIFTFWAQIWGQSRTTITRAAVIFAMEPVAVAGLAAVLLGEVIGPWGFFGSGLIMTGVLIVALRPRTPAKVAAAAGES